MKVVVGLGNPGPRYDDTRHNVGWWVVDRLAHDWDFPTFESEGPAVVSEGAVLGEAVRLLKPTTFMNRSGAALRLVAGEPEFDPETDLLVVVDDATREVGRLRFRSEGGAGGHNGLRSIAGALGHERYPRLRVGVGVAPEGRDLAEWVLSPLPPEEEDEVLRLLPELTRAVECWISDGIEAAMNRFNR